MSEKKTDQAMRLLEAMSGVDPELLARSEKAGASENKKDNIIPFWHYARVAAACLAFCVAGGLCWMTVQHGGAFGQKASETPQSSGNAASYFAPQGAAKSDGANMAADMSARDAETAKQAEACEEMTIAEDANGGPMDTEDCNEAECENSVASELAGYEGKQAAINGDNTQGSAQEGALEAFLARLGIGEKRSYKVTPENVSMDLNMALQLGDAEGSLALQDSMEARVLYVYLQNLELAPAEDADAMRDFQAELVIQVVQDGDQVIEGYLLNGRYFRRVGDDTLYVIQNEDYDFEALCREAERMIQGGTQ